MRGDPRGQSPGGSGADSANSPAPPKTASGQSATVGVANENIGKILVDSQGRTLYLFERDSGTKSTCTGACAIEWPPLGATGKPTVGDGANASIVATSARSDGKSQVTVEYEGNTPVRVDAVVVSSQHSPDVTHGAMKVDITEKIINRAIPAELIARNEATIAALKRDIQGKSGSALLDFIRTDIEELKQLGVAEVFTPGAPTRRRSRTGSPTSTSRARSTVPCSSTTPTSRRSFRP